MKNINILGSTGSIGVNALKVCEKLKFNIVALTVNNNINLLEEQVRKFKPRYVCVYNEQKFNEFKNNIKDIKDITLFCGYNGLCEITKETESSILLNSLVGMVGLEPTINAIKGKKDIALANKECLVSAGKLIMDMVKLYGVNIIPVDSELSAIYQCLRESNAHNYLDKLIVTASGGPFFGKDRDYLLNVTPEMALKHPNWKMGRKVTIDSATLMNKGLEVSEATFLFDIDVENIDVLVHRQSIIHSMVQFKDSSIIAQLSDVDMKLPIQYAMTFPERLPSLTKKIDLAEISTLTFSKPNEEVFKCLKYAKKALKIGGLASCIVNSANEIAVEKFLNNEIKFLDIADFIDNALNSIENNYKYTLEDVLNKDIEVRKFLSK